MDELTHLQIGSIPLTPCASTGGGGALKLPLRRWVTFFIYRELTHLIFAFRKLLILKELGEKRGGSHP
jgi:hypothetical protein